MVGHASSRGSNMMVPIAPIIRYAKGSPIMEDRLKYTRNPCPAAETHGIVK